MDSSENKTYLIIIRKLTEYFEENHLKPGDKLPPEDVLASRLYFGRPALREALRVMELMGVIETNRGRANIYIKDKSKGLLHFFTAFSELYDDGFWGLSMLRANIEVIGVESFIEKADEIDMMELELVAKRFLHESSDIMVSCSDDSYHIKFHQLIVKYSASEFEKDFLTLCICSQFLSSALKDLQNKTMDIETLKEFKEGRMHLDIIQAIKDKDVVNAKRIVRNHVLYYSDMTKL